MEAFSNVNIEEELAFIDFDSAERCSERSWTFSPGPPSSPDGFLTGSWHDLVDLGKPQGISHEIAIKIGKEMFGLKVVGCLDLPSERDRNFLLTTSKHPVGDARAGPAFVLKFSNLTDTRELLEMQNQAMLALSGPSSHVRAPLPCLSSRPQGTKTNSVETTKDANGNTVLVRCVSYLPGVVMAASSSSSSSCNSSVAQDPSVYRQLGEMAGEMDNVMRDFWHPAAHRDLVWDLSYGAGTINRYLHLVTDSKRRELITRILERYEGIGGTARMRALRKAVIHNDINDHNVVIHTPKKGERALGIIDFGDMLYSELVNNLAILLAYALLCPASASDPLKPAREVVPAYHSRHPLEEEEIEVLLTLTQLRLATSCVLAARSSNLAPDNAEYLTVTEQPAWQLLQILDTFDLSAATHSLKLACGIVTPTPHARRMSAPPLIQPLKSSDSKAKGSSAGKNIADELNPENPISGLNTLEDILRLREAHISSNLSVSYRSAPAGPIHMVRGSGAWMFDAAGQRYLDCVNNVAHVGHSHPRIQKVAAAQLELLNTNTRFIYPELPLLAKMIADTMPAPLEVVFLVCTGSEANDLALRLARAATQHASDVIVMEQAYHGHTTALIDLSPYKFSGPGGRGKADHVHILPSPDPLRETQQGGGSTPRGDVKRAISAVQRRGQRLAAFFCESVLGCAGQVFLPPGFLAEVYSEVRGAGGVCVADEVQCGFGRLGDHFWGFQEQGVVPDIVTLGKPMGNGLAVAAVVTTRAVADAFNNGMEYFNTFGGSNLACVVGIEVLNIIKEERLQDNARVVGEFLLCGLRELAAIHPCLGDVRGRGLFLGIEVVLPSEPSLPPAPTLAAFLAAKMRERRVLISTDGPHHNVLKFKPPLCFNKHHAAVFLGALGAVLHEDLPLVKTYLVEQDMEYNMKTPGDGKCPISLLPSTKSADRSSQTLEKHEELQVVKCTYHRTVALALGISMAVVGVAWFRSRRVG